MTILKKAFIVLRTFDTTVDDLEPERDYGSPEYVDCRIAEAKWKKIIASPMILTRSILRAKLYASLKEASEDYKILDRVSPLEMLCQVDVLEWDRLRPIVIHQLRLRAKELFKLKATTPALILADKYDEAEMPEEAKLLRENGSKL